MSLIVSIQPYLVLVENVVCLCLQMYTVVTYGIILYKLKFDLRKFSYSIIIYMTMAILFTILSFIMMTYYIIFWRPSEVQYNARIFWFFGFPAFISMTAVSLSVLFLGIERCLLLLFPYFFNERKRKFFAGIEIILLVLLMTTQTFVYSFYTPESPLETTNCYAFGCLLLSQNFYLNVRNIVALLICGTGMLLFYVFYKKSKNFNGQKTKYNKNNKLVLSTIGAALIFDFLPHFAVFCSFTFFDINPSKYIGPYGFIVTTIDTFTCAEISRRILTKKEPNLNRVIAITSSKT